MSGMLSTWNTSPMLQAQAVYNGVLAAAKCSSAACLAGLNATVLAAAATKAHASVPQASWAPAVDGVETLGSPFNLSNAGVMHSGPVLFGTARDETCSLEGRTWSFHLDAQEFEAYLQKAVPEANASKLVQLYGNQIRPSTTRAHRPVSPYWWSAIEWSSDFAFHCPSRHLARGLTSHARTAFLFSHLCTTVVSLVHLAMSPSRRMPRPGSPTQLEFRRLSAVQTACSLPLRNTQATLESQYPAPG